MSINICFPSDPLCAGRVDDVYFLDAREFATLGVGILVWSMDSPNSPVRATKEYAHHKNAPTYWRGWMLSMPSYSLWLSALGSFPAILNADNYAMHHRMRHWVPQLKGFTPDTWFLQNAEAALLHMFPCHVKDGVKSANASHLPRPCQTIDDVLAHQSALVSQRGVLDDGLVLRLHQELDTSFDEVRVWVFGSTMRYYANGVDSAHLTPWLNSTLMSMDPAFLRFPFSMDISRNTEGEYFVMDVGDAGVSDYKEGHADLDYLQDLRGAWHKHLISCLPPSTISQST